MPDTDNHLQPFNDLAPDEILNAIESIGFTCDGHVSALNSYENRVYQVGIEDSKPVIAKFYRPHRWSDACILEEHAFTAALVQAELPVIHTLTDASGQTLFHAGPYRIAIYPRVGGRAPELDDADHLLRLGRCLARLHNVAATQTFQHRPSIDIQGFVTQPCEFLLENNFIPADIRKSFESITGFLEKGINACYARAGHIRLIRLHGDCHIGNILWYNDGPFLVDFDDARMGPAIQDLWMLLSGDRSYMTARLHDLLEGYTEFRILDARELHLVEALRTMRMVHYAGWLARRWEDPAFKHAFPWFNTQQYWEAQILHLKEQLALMDEPPLEMKAV